MSGSCLHRCFALVVVVIQILATKALSGINSLWEQRHFDSQRTLPPLESSNYAELYLVSQSMPQWYLGDIALDTEDILAITNILAKYSLADTPGKLCLQEKHVELELQDSQQSLIPYLNSLYAVPIQSSIFVSKAPSIVYVNSMLDSFINIDACNNQSLSEQSSLLGNCTIRSAIAYCNSIWTSASTDDCVVHFPIAPTTPPQEVTLALNPLLGDISVSGVSGTLIVFGNGCRVIVDPTSGTNTSIRFLTLVGPPDTSLHFRIYNLTLDSFITTSRAGGALSLSDLAGVLLQDIIFINNRADYGGGVYVKGCSDVRMVRCGFINGYARHDGGAVYFAYTSNTTVVDCTFTNNSAYSAGGSVTLGATNNYITLERCIFHGGMFKDTAYPPDFGGEIFIDTDNSVIIISGSQFLNSFAYNGGAIFSNSDNSFISIFDCLFQGTESEMGGALFSYELMIYLHIWNCSFIDTVAENGGAIYIYQRHYFLAIINCTFIQGTRQTNKHIGYYYGGAIYAETMVWNLEISGCVFMNTRVWYRGGAVYLFERTSYMIIEKCTFINTRAGHEGGAVCAEVYNSHNRITDCVFINTTSESDGGAIYLGTINDNFFISNSLFVNTTAWSVGGGVGIISSNRAIKIENCTFRGTVAGLYGGAFFADYDNEEIVVNSLRITDSKASSGGGLYLGGHNDNFILTNSVCLSNTAENDGGAVLLRDSNSFVIFENNTFQANTAGHYGGAVAVSCSNTGMIIEHCTFVDNLSKLGGGGIHSTFANTDFTVRKSQFEGNFGLYGGALHFGNDHYGITISDCIIRNGYSTNGGGIYIAEFSSDVSVESTIFENNSAILQGGAMFSEASKVYMQYCRIMNNAAQDGAGICAPVVTVVTIFASQFEGNVASGFCGGIFVSHASAVTLFDNNFTSNKAEIGGALGIATSSTINITTNTFQNNTALTMAGALYVSSSGSISITHSTFDSNVASFQSGSAMYLASCEMVTIEGNSFVANEALHGGGTVYWLASTMDEPSGLQNIRIGNEDDGHSQTMASVGSKESTMASPTTTTTTDSSNYFAEDNIALYGNFIATDAYRLILDQTNSYDVINYQTYIPPITVALVDYYAQIVRTESSAVMLASILSPTDCYRSTGYVTGSVLEQSHAGITNFTSLLAFCDPGYNMSVNITTSFDRKLSTFFHLSFRACQRGEYYGDSVCTPCELGTYSLTDPSTTTLDRLSNKDICNPCPSGSSRCYGDTIELQEGYWRISDSATTLLGCPYGDRACIGGVGSGDELCRNGYTGPLCGLCQTGYSYQAATQKCELCGESAAVDAVTVAAAGLLVLVLVVGYFVLFRSFKINSMDDLYVLVLTKLGIIENSSSSSSAESCEFGNPQHHARRVVRRFSSRLKVYVTLYQIVSIMPFTLDLRFPDAYTQVLSVLHAFNVDITRSSLVSCSTGHDYDGVDTLVIATVFPLIVTAVLFISQVVHMKILMTSDPDSPEINARIARVRANYHKAFLVFTYLILPSTSAKIFQVFSCRDVDPDDLSPGYDEYMVMDYSVNCSSDEYRFGYIWAMACIVVYPIGIPLLYFYELYSVREGIQTRDIWNNCAHCNSPTSQDHKHGRSTNHSFGKQQVEQLLAIRFLYESYSPVYWYWEVIETFRRLLLTGVLVLIAQGSAVQIIVGMSLSLSSLKLLDIYRPHADNAVYSIETVSQWQVCFIFFLVLLAKADFGSVDYTALDAMFVIAVFTNILVDIFKVLVWVSTKKKKITEEGQVYQHNQHISLDSNPMSPAFTVSLELRARSRTAEHTSSILAKSVNRIGTDPEEFDEECATSHSISYSTAILCHTTNHLFQSEFSSGGCGGDCSVVNGHRDGNGSETNGEPAISPLSGDMMRSEKGYSRSGSLLASGGASGGSGNTSSIRTTEPERTTIDSVIIVDD